MNRKYIPLILCPLLLTACGQDNRLPRSPEELEQFAESIAQENITETETPTSALPETSEEPTTETTTEPTTEPINNDITEYILTADELPEDLVIPENAVCCRTEFCPETAAFGIESTTYWFYDAHGNEIGSIGYYDGKPEENSRTVTEYEYNEDGTIAVQTVSDYFGETEYRYTYNADGTVNECFTFEDGVEYSCNLYEYNKFGDVKKEYYIEDNVIYWETAYRNQYDEDGGLVKQTRGEGELGWETEYFYDAQGRVIREIVRSTYLEYLYYDTIYGYDAQGRKLPLEMEQGDEDYALHLWYGYVYFDDTEGTQ